MKNASNNNRNTHSVNIDRKTKATNWVLVETKSQNDPTAILEAQEIADEAVKAGYPTKLVDADAVIMLSQSQPARELLVDRRGGLLGYPTTVLVRSGALTTERTLVLLRILERHGVRVIPSTPAIQVAKHKFDAQQMLASAGIPVADAALVHETDALNENLIQRFVGSKVCIKSGIGTCGEQVAILKNKAEREELVEQMGQWHAPEGVVLQKFHGQMNQRAVDIRALVVDGEPIAAMKRTAAKGQRVANFSRGGSVEAYPIDAMLRELSRRVCQVLSLKIAGVDWLIDEKGNVCCCEANISPGKTGIQKAHPKINFARHFAISAFADEPLDHLDERRRDGTTLEHLN